MKLKIPEISRIICCILLFSYNILNAQMGTAGQLEIDYGLQAIKLGQHIDAIKSNHMITKYQCAYCSLIDTISPKYVTTKEAPVSIEGIVMNTYFHFYFLADTLIKMDMQFRDQENSMTTLLNYFNKRYGKKLPNEKGKVIWESKSVYLEADFYYHKDRGNIVLYLKKEERSINNEITKLEENVLIKQGYKYTGNSTFIPSFTFFNKLFAQKIRENDVSKLLPRYSLTRDTVDKIIKLTYGFYHEGKTSIILTLDKSGYIKEAVIFNSRSDSDLNSKVLKAGYKRDDVTSSYSHTTTKYYVHPAGTSFS